MTVFHESKRVRIHMMFVLVDSLLPTV